MPGLSFYDRQHVQKVLAQQGVINNIFNQFILSVSPYLRKWNDTGSNNVWVRNQVVERAVDRELLNLEAMLKANISAFQVEAWDRSNAKNDDFIRKYIEGMSISAATKEGMFTHNLTALEALQKSVDANGLSLSDRVWDITQQTKTQIEFYLNSGVAVGRNATGISSDVRQILHDPDKRFRRVRNGKGNLVPSRPMKDYHPGQGVYRSAYMNALRTSATTTNIAYRSADYERWSKQDFVLGIEVQRSGNHKGPCKICDAMVGKYPKTFKFTGWHPFCICFATPIVMEPEDLADYLLTDKVPERLAVTIVPQGAQDFVYQNKDGLRSAFWYRDNFSNGVSFKNNQVYSSEKPLKVVSFKPKKTDEVKKDIQKRWLYRKVSNTESEIRMNKKFETGVVFDSKGNILIDKRGASYSVSFEKEELLRMKDGIMTHNHPRGWGYPENSLGRIGNSFSVEDISLAVFHDLAEMRAVTPNFTFAMKRPEAGWGDYKEAIKVINEENKKLQNEFQIRIYGGTLTPNQANATHYHILWKRVSKRLGWEYSKSKTR